MTPQQIFSDMGETLGESAPTYSTDAKWHAEFKRGRSSSDDLHRCGRTATSVNEETVEVHKLVMSDRRLSVCYIATSVGISTGSLHSTSVGISTGSLHSILTDNLMMKKVSARWVPRMLSDVQKTNRVDASTTLLGLFNENPNNFIS